MRGGRARTANKVGRLELLADEGEGEVFEGAVRGALSDAHDEAPARRVGLVLPHRLHAVAEEEDVGEDCERRGAQDVVVHSPEMLDGGEGGDLFDAGAVGLCVGGRRRAATQEGEMEGRVEG